MAAHTTQYRMDLNNALQAQGALDRLRWGDPIKDGPDHCPSWTIAAFIDDIERGRSTNTTLDAAKEEAARQVLRYLRAAAIANLPARGI